MSMHFLNIVFLPQKQTVECYNFILKLPSYNIPSWFLWGPAGIMYLALLESGEHAYIWPKLYYCVAISLRL